MTSLRDTMIAWADQRIEEMLARPRMWGSAEAVEMQVLQLLEIRALAFRPAQEIENPRRVLDTYLSFLRDRYPRQPPSPLFQLVDNTDGEEFGDALCAFRKMLLQTSLAENPFEHSELAIQLTFDAGVQPSTSACTGYYEEFRRAARAAVRAGDKAVGRAKKDIERATDFSLEDVVITPPNGAPGSVLLRLGAGTEGRDGEAPSLVRDALSTIMTLAEWASTDADVTELHLDDVAQRTRTAVQALRLLPRRTIQTVAIGGRLVARTKPVELRASHEKRFLDVVRAVLTPEPFDTNDEIRAVDLDRGMFILGEQQRVSCFARPDVLGEIAYVGTRARVVGQRYRPVSGRPFVIAESVELEAAPPED